MTQRYLILDYETRSEADLKRCGAFEYSLHPSTQILCAAWRIGTRETLRDTPTRKWSPALTTPDKESLEKELLSALRDPDVLCLAHNALFEQVITRYVLSRMKAQSFLRSLPHTRWACTAAQAASFALPRNLEGACLALGLKVQKDMDGRKLMLKMSKPRKATKNNSAKWHCSRADLDRLMKYCATDIDAETELFLALPPLNATERKVWLLDQEINFRGFKADRELVDKVLIMVGEETTKLNKETEILSLGMIESTTQRDAVIGFLESEGVHLPDLTAKTISDALAADLVSGDAKRMLEIRQAVSKTSTAKYHAFETRSRYDGRVRDILMYHGASTGRWTGLGLQPHNFPRGNIKNTVQAAEILRTGDLELVRMIYGDPMNVFSSCLRSVIVAPEGREFFCADYAAIEARVLFWIAKHEAGLQAFRDNRPIYAEMAMAIYDKPLEECMKPRPEYEVGKRAILGLGYNMGAKKFFETCKQFGQEVSEELSQIAVGKYRKTHYPVPILWNNIQRAAIAAVLNKGKKYKINYTSWWVDERFLYCELPSGRRLSYYGPEVRYVKTPWDDKRPALYHWSVNPTTKKWECAGTYGGRLVENIVQAIARDLMAGNMLLIKDAGYDVILTVHDEILAENDKGKGSKKEFESLMATVPPWASGCPIKVEGWVGPRYHK